MKLKIDLNSETSYTKKNQIFNETNSFWNPGEAKLVKIVNDVDIVECLNYSNEAIFF